ncbi:MAG: hypothetical protein J1E63_03970 [Muribaculaceae bacterium]|nr:hypothetical protein [Muribaculaceae bacterium]
MQNISINLVIPQGWYDLSEKQLRFVFRLIADGFNSDELKILCLLRWSKLKVIGRRECGAYLLKKDKIIFELTPLTLAEVLPFLDWLGSVPSYPVRLAKIKGRDALPADFVGVPFEKFIMADNLYQGYLHTQDDSLLDELAGVLYGGVISLNPAERISVFYWMASLKHFFARKFSDFLQPAAVASDGNLLGSSSPNVEEAMNAQIRALTKGDVTKESQILAIDTWRALTELNAQAREYKEMNAKINNK